MNLSELDHGAKADTEDWCKHSQWPLKNGPDFAKLEWGRTTKTVL